MKKIAVTGSNGLLGQTLVNLLLKDQHQYKVYGLSRGENRSGRSDFDYHTIDITEYDQLNDCLQKIQPDFIVNTAAMTHVDVREDDKENCDKLNVEAVKYLIQISSSINAHLIHISTDFILHAIAKSST